MYWHIRNKETYVCRYTKFFEKAFKKHHEKRNKQ